MEIISTPVVVVVLDVEIISTLVVVVAVLEVEIISASVVVVVAVLFRGSSSRRSVS